MNTILARLREPSTWAGLATLVALFGGRVTTEQVSAVAELGAAAAAAAAVFLREGK